LICLDRGIGISKDNARAGPDNPITYNQTRSIKNVWVQGFTTMHGSRPSSRKSAKGMRLSASNLAREIKALEGIEGAAKLAGERQAEASRLQEQARERETLARLEDITVWEDCIVKQTNKGEKKYRR